MATISGAQFFGGQPGVVVNDALNKSFPSPETQKPGIVQRVKQDLTDTSKQAMDTYEQGATGQISPIRAATGVVAQDFNAIPKVASEFLPEVARKGLDSAGQGIGKGLQWLAEKTTPQFLVDFVTKHPDAAKMLEEGAGTLSNTGQIAGDILASDQAAKGIQKGINGLSKAGTGIKNITNDIKDSVQGSPVSTQEDLLKGATKHVTPDYESATQNQKIKMQNQRVRMPDGTTQPRVVEGNSVGPVRGYRKINLTPGETSSAKTLSEVPGYNPSSTNLETHNLIKEEIGNEAKNLRSSLQKEGQAVPKKEIVSTVRKAIQGASRDSLSLQSTDPALVKYMRVLKNATAKAKGDLEGVLDIRQAMDDAYENARGNLAYGSDRMSALDEIHKAGRNALNEFGIKNAKNTDVKTSFQKQTNLYRADDVINAKAAREGSSSIERVENKIKNSPVAKTVSKLPVVGKYMR